MRLINPGLGELADRLSILALKIAHAAQEGKDAAHLITERAALLTKFRFSLPESTGAHEALFGLMATNAMLWYAEEALREWRNSYLGDAKTLGEPELRDVTDVAFRIQALNDQRAAFVRTLNQLAGTDLGPEKL